MCGGQLALVLMAVRSIRPNRRMTATLFTSCAYAVDASASNVTGYEYAHHHATLNFLMDFLNKLGLQT